MVDDCCSLLTRALNPLFKPVGTRLYEQYQNYLFHCQNLIHSV